MHNHSLLCGLDAVQRWIFKRGNKPSHTCSHSLGSYGGMEIMTIDPEIRALMALGLSADMALIEISRIQREAMRYQVKKGMKG